MKARTQHYVLKISVRKISVRNFPRALISVRKISVGNFPRALISVRKFPSTQLSVRIFPCGTFLVRIFPRPGQNIYNAKALLSPKLTEVQNFCYGKQS